MHAGCGACFDRFFINDDGILLKVLPDVPLGILIIKKHFSCFFGTELISILISCGIDTVVLVGVSTSGCVRSTAISSSAYGFYTIIPLECVADRSTEIHKGNLFDINAKFGDVVPLEEVVDYFNKLS